MSHQELLCSPRPLCSSSHVQFAATGRGKGGQRSAAAAAADSDSQQDTRSAVQPWKRDARGGFDTTSKQATHLPHLSEVTLFWKPMKHQAAQLHFCITSLLISLAD